MDGGEFSRDWTGCRREESDLGLLLPGVEGRDRYFSCRYSVFVLPARPQVGTAGGSWTGRAQRPCALVSTQVAGTHRMSLLCLRQLGGCDKDQRRGSVNATQIRLELRVQIPVPAALGPGDSVSWLCPHRESGGQLPGGPSYTATNLVTRPVTGAAASGPHPLPEGPPPNTIAGGLGFYTCICGDTMHP